jgi:hypothetical protein
VPRWVASSATARDARVRADGCGLMPFARRARRIGPRPRARQPAACRLCVQARAGAGCRVRNDSTKRQRTQIHRRIVGRAPA